MQFRARSIFMLATLVALSLPDAAAADRGNPPGVPSGARPHLVLQRDFESAMSNMDRHLAALLASRTMDCAGEDAAGGMETCWVSLESVQAAETSRGPAHH
jgi:hypothetical protein